MIIFVIDKIIESITCIYIIFILLIVKKLFNIYLKNLFYSKKYYDSTLYSRVSKPDCLLERSN
jgi:hypothetical protein